MKSLCRATLLLFAFMLAFSQTGLAADSTFNWTGPYVGVHMGYGVVNADPGTKPLPDAATFINLAPASQSLHAKGVLGGVQAGYNWQMGCFVLGIEADFSGSGMSGTSTQSPIIQYDGTPFPGDGYLRTHLETNWFGTVRPRLGYTVLPNLLIYGTGGLAYGNVSFSGTTNFLPPGNEVYRGTIDDTKVGWTAGAGAEYALSKKWSVKAEYLFYDLGSASVTADPSLPNPPFQERYNVDTATHLIDIGLNYRF